MSRKLISLDDLVALRPVNEERVRKLRNSIISESRAVRLAEFRKEMGLTQVGVAKILDVDQSNVSRIEHGKFAHTEIGTLQAYIEALGGTLEITARVGKVSHILIDAVQSTKPASVNGNIAIAKKGSRAVTVRDSQPNRRTVRAIKAARTEQVRKAKNSKELLKKLNA